MSKRLVNHDKYHETLIGQSCENQNTLLVALTDFFSERIFMHNRSKLLQYLPLYFIGHGDKNLIKALKPLPQNAVYECRIFSQLLVSRLISIALPVRGEELNHSRKSSDSSDEGNGQSRIAFYEKRMKAINYIGSLMT